VAAEQVSGRYVVPYLSRQSGVDAGEAAEDVTAAPGLAGRSA
jgi:hypothetical protein